MSRWVCALAILVATLFCANSAVLAHSGGTPRLTNAEAGPYRIYAWTEPEPLVVGEVHLSIMLTIPADEQVSKADPGNGTQVEVPVSDAQVDVTFRLAKDPEAVYVIPATQEKILNEIYYDTELELAEDGDWQVTVAADGPKGMGETTFTLRVLPNQGPNWTLIIGGGIVLVVSGGLAIVWSRTQSPATVSQGRPGRAKLGQQQRRK